VRIGERRNSAKAKLAKGKEIERKRAEEALRESEEKLRVMFESISDGVSVVDLEGKVVDANRAHLRMFGFSHKGEIIGQSAFDSIAEKDRARAIEAMGKIGKISEKEFSTPAEYTLLNKDGREFSAELSTALLHDGSGNPTGIISVIRDITERKRAEEALQESEVRYRTLVSNIPGAVYRAACDPEKWTIHFFSDAIQEISGYPPSDFIGDKVRTYKSIIHLDDMKMVEKIVLDCVSKKEPFELEYRIVCADGSIHWVHDRGQGVFDKKSELLWLDGVVIDITERKLADGQIRKAEEEKLKANKRRIEELEKSMDVAVGHELALIELKGRIRTLELKLREITGK